MGGQHYIPQAHDQFHTWQGNFYNYISEKQESFNINEADMQELTALKAEYKQAFKRASSLDTANRADRVERNRCEAEYKRVIRRIINENIRYNSAVSDYDRQYIGLNIPDTTPTAAHVPVTHPVLNIDFSETLHHTIRIKDAKLDSKRKPAGVTGCEIWYKIADAEPNNDDLQYAGTATKSTFFLDFNSENEGKKVWYRGRWINTRGKHGTWSPYTSAIIA